MYRLGSALVLFARRSRTPCGRKCVFPCLLLAGGSGRVPSWLVLLFFLCRLCIFSLSFFFFLFFSPLDLCVATTWARGSFSGPPPLPRICRFESFVLFFSNREKKRILRFCGAARHKIPSHKKNTEENRGGLGKRGFGFYYAEK
nr:hypothetical protein [Pandoravirus aubagnensis]